jgi:putative tricarboxylic transport membrane protein
MKPRHGALHAALFAALLVVLPGAARAIDNIEIMAPAAPGGGYDRTARALQNTIEKEGLGKNISVVNVGGAGGAIGLAQFIRNKAGRGDAMLVGGFGMVASTATNKSPVTLADVTPLARLTSEYSLVVVPKNSPIGSLKDLVDRIKAGPRAVSFAGGSAGGNDHIVAALILQALGIDPRQVNYIAFSGGGDSLASILGGQVTVGVGGYSELIEQVKAGNLRALAISSEQRMPDSDIPTLREQGVNATQANWRGVTAPPRLSSAQRQDYLTLVDKAVASPTWKGHLQSNAWASAYLAGDAFKGYIADETRSLIDLLTRLGLVK